MNPTEDGVDNAMLGKLHDNSVGCKIISVISISACFIHGLTPLRVHNGQSLWFIQFAVMNSLHAQTRQPLEPLTLERMLWVLLLIPIFDVLQYPTAENEYPYEYIDDDQIRDVPYQISVLLTISHREKRIILNLH
eukprot:scaffold260581_cov20-Prasinocladus_malaysianus.AAC.1